jgi:predicted ferric reductase
MNAKPDVTRHILSPGPRRLLEITIFGLALILLAFMGWIAFGSPASGPMGPAGLDSWLVTLGRMSGILAASLVLLQYLLSGRVKLLDRVFALNRLLILHRGVAVAAAVLGTLHPLLLFAPETRQIGPFFPGAWPVYLGPVVLIGLWTVVVVSLWRIFLGIPFQRWWILHRLGVFSLVALIGLHVFIVGTDFMIGWPRTLLASVFGVYVLFFVYNKLFKPLRMRSGPYTVASVTPLEGKANLIELDPPGDRAFPYAPGQFSFVRFLSPNVSREEHHFTLSSTPTRGDRLNHTIKCLGDYTATLGRLRPGDKALMDGPYGLFTYLAYAPKGKRLLLIAAGIGITPLLSMLRHLADHRDPRPITLIWSNRKRTDILFQDELQEMRSVLPGLTVHHVLTREEDWEGPKGRLDKSMLEGLLTKEDQEGHVFLCGPPAMMDAVERALKDLGFSGKRIHTERFAL